MKKMMAKWLVAAGLMLFLITPAQASPECLSLTANGNGMAPTICNGDIIRVQLDINVSLINPGSQTNPSSGDIIIYAAMVAGYVGAMWTCSRVISKYFKDGHWYFKTKMDNRTEPDPWEVPDYSLLGIVVDVIPNVKNPDSGSATAANSLYNQSSSEVGPRGGLPEFATLMLEFTIGIALGSTLGLAIEKGLANREYFNAKLKNVRAHAISSEQRVTR